MNLFNSFVALGVSGGLLHVFAEQLGVPNLAVVGKPFPVWMMAAILLLHRRQRHSGRSSLWVAIGLLFSGLGDVLLDAGPFVAGMAAFAVAHIFYIIAATDSRRLGAVGLVGCVAWGGALYGFLAPNLGALQVPVGLYTVVLVTMMWRALARYAAPGGRIFAMGAVLFGLSDSLIALKIAEYTFDGQQALILLLYWGGQLGLARGAWELDQPAEVPGEVPDKPDAA